MLNNLFSLKSVILDQLLPTNYSHNGIFLRNDWIKQLSYISINFCSERDFLFLFLRIDKKRKKRRPKKSRMLPTSQAY